MITSVVLARASAAQSRVLPGSPGGRCAETTVKPWVRLRWVSGMPASAGAAIAELTPGIDRDRDAGLGAGLPLLAAAAEDEVVAALQPDDRRPARPCSTSSSLIRSCGV